MQLKSLSQNILDLDRETAELERLRALNAGAQVIPPILFKQHPDRSRYEDTGGPRMVWPFPQSTWLQQRRRELREGR